jgi:hypothetical protein
MHVILDDYALLERAPIQRWFAKRPRYLLHFMPATAWNDLVTRWVIDPAVQGQPGAASGTRVLIKPIRRRRGARHTPSTPVSWVRIADEILASLAAVTRQGRGP